MRTLLLPGLLLLLLLCQLLQSYSLLVQLLLYLCVACVAVSYGFSKLSCRFLGLAQHGESLLCVCAHVCACVCACVAVSYGFSQLHYCLLGLAQHEGSLCVFLCVGVKMSVHIHQHTPAVIT
jgi:hypothetical protein